METYFIAGENMTEAKNVSGFHAVQMNETDQARVCFNFTIGISERKEFYSPNYPRKYPNNTICIKEITAPYGYRIELDFRDNFHLEEANNCEYDYLEIRNGPHGYSDLLGRYCGSSFPPLLRSKDHRLWLKFSSDDSIEYLGFRAVYRFVSIKNFDRPPAEECIFYKGGSDGFISNKDITESMFNYSLKWNEPLDCTWFIEIYTGWKMYLTFQKYQLAQPNNCDLNYIDIYGESLSVDARLDRFCGTATEPQRSNTNIMHVRYFAESEALDGSFTILYTGFRESEHCDESVEFNCGDGTCIEKSLKCNGHFNCKYRYDEEDTICSVGSSASVVLSSEHMIIILVVFFALVFGMCLSISISCYNKIKERKEVEREYRQRRSKYVSMEKDLDEKVSSLDKNLGILMTTQNTRIPVGSQKNNHKETLEEEGDGCHVPEIYFSVFDKHPNGGSSVNRLEDHSPGSTPDSQVAITVLPDGSQHYPFCSYHRVSESPPLPSPPPPPLPHHLRKNREETDSASCLVFVDSKCPKHNRPVALRTHQLEDLEVPSFPQEMVTEAVVELYPNSPGRCRYKYDHPT
ncbi:neuropilin and tolloid-like protein 2 [Limulus polyphemus]|uniref:Neuropilin and tolloid-like protein 2 n=1 Tax=Limulus polyphemus TaxID=6850 RepID=A0ABM1SKV3_LIMPO|nr:neuropilin and tolloid-like protein 2 [Limulus polyphemus]